MTEVRAFLVSALEKVTTGGEVSYEELRAACPAPDALPDEERGAWFALSYWYDDADLRAKDPAYGPMRLEGLVRHLELLRRRETRAHAFPVEKDMSKVCVVAAGGTGGHMFPAEALAREMAARGWRVVLATDRRGEQYAANFPAEEKLYLDAATGSGPVALLKAGVAILKGVLQARSAFKRLNPAVVVGFGGYPSAPALVAALSQGRPTLIHEQNAVLGRTNRMLAGRVKAVASSFPTLVHAPAGLKAHLVGSPVRAEIRALFDRPYAAPDIDGPIHVLVTGGSQGARLLSETTPRALAALPDGLKRRLKVQQQSRPETLETARQIYLEAGIEAEVAPFFRDMAARLSAAHLVVGRAGASTCAELAVAALPSVLIPLKIATDDHQTLNAKALTDVGAAWVIAEDLVTVDHLAGDILPLLSHPKVLAKMSAAARSVAIPDAAARLADLAEATAAN